MRILLHPQFKAQVKEKSGYIVHIVPNVTAVLVELYNSKKKLSFLHIKLYQVLNMQYQHYRNNAVYF